MSLTRDQLGPEPLRALRTWLDEARERGSDEEVVVTLATVDQTGAPDARLVVVRTADDQGLTYYGDARWLKGRHIAADPRATMLAYWPAPARQVRVRGEVSTAPGAESDAAFASRERRSQIGYWANEQSAPVADRAALVSRQDAIAARFETEEITRPEHWVVYRLRPYYVEFWQRGERNLHDRIAYTRANGGGWHAERLQP